MNPLLSVSIPLILASASPRRRTLLNQLQVPFSVQVSPADETVEEHLPPDETARQLAHRKATPVADAYPSALVVAADTIVVHEDTILGKPNSPDEAIQMLERLAGTTHSVYTGLALHHAESSRERETGRETRVQLSTLSRNEIEAYVDTGSPMDKAGGYGIQDHTAPLFIEDLNGDYYNVMGLPLHTLYETLQAEFSDLLA